MSTYVIGDVQGCYAAFMQLLAAIGFDPRRDRLWLTGDLVNRGEDSLSVLRWCRRHEDSLVAVLGNHDLHLLAVAAGYVRPHRKDTLGPILEAPDREELLGWLRQRPLVHREGDWLMVHAGLMPQWTADAALALGGELQAVLQGPDWRDFLRQMYGNEPRHWSEALTGMDRLRLIANACTRMRYLHPDGGMEFLHKCAPLDAPPGLIPWYDMPGRMSRDVRIAFGHWSTLGLMLRADVAALDTGCLWGGRLTALRLEDGRTFQVGCHARLQPGQHE
ncbi:MAG: symmetrical bis(5'-nucleosyl)-tetraphosphatase [Thiobacillaceae bacterium]|nr:symmetrical bis(5'-nucleosyl)-tetraphosphatase [Thiobacillaceae bacterium]MDW8324554.1 symmetrical bis(5'-nucleosyl)-tetraphosphatase [Burkholderiales bacterium]